MSNNEVRSKESHLLPLSGKVLSDNTKLILKVSKLFIHANVLELQGSSLYHVMNVMITDLYVLRLVVEYMILYHFYAALVVT